MTGGSHTYVIESLAYLKIGVAKHILPRIKGLQTGNPAPLTLLAYWPTATEFDAYALEGTLHDRLHRFRHQGEWFSCGLDEVIKHAKTPPVLVKKQEHVPQVREWARWVVFTQRETPLDNRYYQLGSPDLAVQVGIAEHDAYCLLGFKSKAKLREASRGLNLYRHVADSAAAEDTFTRYRLGAINNGRQRKGLPGLTNLTFSEAAENATLCA